MAGGRTTPTRVLSNYQEFIALEAEANSITRWSIALFPGLLQTEEYAGSCTPLQFDVVMDESVLIRKTGGSGAMYAQLEVARATPDLTS